MTDDGVRVDEVGHDDCWQTTDQTTEVVTTMTDQTLLLADAVSVTYPNGVEALRDFTLEVNRGEFVAIVGPSGCGKSTLLRALAGLIHPTSGRVLLNGEEVTQPSNQVGMLFQEPALLPWRTVEKNIRLPMELGKRDWRFEIRDSTDPRPQSPISNLGSPISSTWWG